MRVLCCLDDTNVGQVSKATEMLSAAQPLTVGILYVTDTGPRRDIEHTRERFLRPPGPPRPREHEMRQAEHAAAEDILNEALRYLPNAEFALQVPEGVIDRSNGHGRDSRPAQISNLFEHHAPCAAVGESIVANQLRPK